MSSVKESLNINDVVTEKVDQNVLIAAILQQKNVSKHLNDLSNELTSLNNKLKSHIISKHDDLMNHVVGIEKLEGVLEMMCSRSNTLFGHTQKVLSKIEEPYDNLASRISQLENMQVTCDTLRKISRINILVNRLGDQKKDPNKASATINELRYLFKNTDWKGIHLLEKYQELVNINAGNLIDEAWNLMKLFKDTNNQAMLSMALQVFCNMDILTPSINKIISDWQSEFTEKIKHIMDIKSMLQSAVTKNSNKNVPGRALLPTAGQAASFRASFWIMVDKLVNYIESNLINVILLVRTLHRKKDATSQYFLIECLLENNSTEQGVELNTFCVQLFSEDVSYAAFEYQLWMSEELKSSFHYIILSDTSNFLKPTLEAEYPKLLKLFQDLNIKLKNHLEASCNESDETIFFSRKKTLSESTSVDDSEKYFRVFLLEYEQTYLSRSLARLFEVVQEAFGEGQDSNRVPSLDEIVNFTKVISNELTMSSGDADLLQKTCKNIGKMIDLITSKCEEASNSSISESEAGQIIGPLTNYQRRNIKFINLLSSFISMVEVNVIRQLHLTDYNQKIIRDKLCKCTQLQMSILLPLVNNIKVSIEEIISTIHSENFDAQTKSIEGSFMMNELKQFVSRVREQYLNEVTDNMLISRMLQPVLNHLISILLINFCLIRPLSDIGKEKISYDIDQFEYAIGPLLSNEAASINKRNILQNLSNIEGWDDNSTTNSIMIGLRRLSSLKSIIFHSNASLVEMYRKSTGSSVNQSQLPASYVLNHFFSRAPPELKSPHNSAGWSLTRYSGWLISHPNEHERLNFIRGALDAYANMVRLQEKKSYAEIYIQMQSILTSLIKE